MNRDAKSNQISIRSRAFAETLQYAAPCRETKEHSGLVLAEDQKRRGKKIPFLSVFIPSLFLHDNHCASVVLSVEWRFDSVCLCHFLSTQKPKKKKIAVISEQKRLTFWPLRVVCFFSLGAVPAIRKRESTNPPLSIFFILFFCRFTPSCLPASVSLHLHPPWLRVPHKLFYFGNTATVKTSGSQKTKQKTTTNTISLYFQSASVTIHSNGNIYFF